MAIRLYIAGWRELRELTQQQLAALLDVNSMTVSRWERAITPIDTDTLDRLADALQIEVTDLFRNPNVPDPRTILRQIERVIADYRELERRLGAGAGAPER